MREKEERVRVLGDGRKEGGRILIQTESYMISIHFLSESIPSLVFIIVGIKTYDISSLSINA